MSFRIPITLALAFACASPAAAQDTCPMQTTQHVQADVTYGPPQHCGGFVYQVGDLQLSMAKGACPLFVVYTPPHDDVVPSPLRTMVDVVSQTPITQTTFVCETRWFLFVPIGTTCVADKSFHVGVVQQLVTRPCAPPSP